MGSLKFLVNLIGIGTGCDSRAFLHSSDAVHNAAAGNDFSVFVSVVVAAASGDLVVIHTF